MKNLLSLALGAITLATLGLTACSRNDLELNPLALRGLAAGAARPDTTPKPPHPKPPPDSTIVTVQFAGSDSTQSGTTGTSRWILGNAGKGPLTVEWTLTETQGWPGFPMTGSMRLRGRSTASLEVAIPVPSSATSGIYTLTMTIMSPAGNRASADGWIRVYGNDEPPPPPPPFPAVRFVGSDSVQAGGTASTYWELGNESDHAFTMNWTLRGPSGWPGLPKQDSIDLQPLERRTIQVAVAVPDTAGPGQRFLEMEVTRPDSLPPASATGWVTVSP